MRKGGESDPRNKTLMKMFNLVNIGERSGSGVPNIFNTWEDQGWKEPVIEERFDPDRTILTLEFVDKTNKEKTAKKTSEENKRRKQAKKTSEGSTIRNKTIENMVKIENYLKENGESKTNAIAEYLNLSSARTRKILSATMIWLWPKTRLHQPKHNWPRQKHSLSVQSRTSDLPT